jgi:hypothetical protein
LRIRSNFALIWVAAAMAIDSGVLPWTKAPTFNVVEKCLRKALEVIEAGKAPGPPVDAAPHSGGIERQARKARFAESDSESRSRRNRLAAATIEQVIAGIPRRPRYYVLDSLERVLRKNARRT